MIGGAAEYQEPSAALERGSLAEVVESAGRASRATLRSRQGIRTGPGRRMKYQDRIVIEPGKRGGQPCIRGLRITIYDVLSYLAAGMTIDEILADFPSLEREDVLACLAYAADRERRTLVARE